MIPVHTNVQFVGFPHIFEEQPEHFVFKSKITNPVFMSSHLYLIWGCFNYSYRAETPCALPIGAVILNLR